MNITSGTTTFETDDAEPNLAELIEGLKAMPIEGGSLFIIVENIKIDQEGHYSEGKYVKTGPWLVEIKWRQRRV